MRTLASWKLVATSAVLVSVLNGCGGGGGGSGGTGGGSTATGGRGGSGGSGASTGGAGGGAACTTGDEGCACYGNQSCNGVLHCYSNLCVFVPTDGGAGANGSAGTSGTGTPGSGGTAGAAGQGAGTGGVAGVAGKTGAAGTTGAGGTAGATGAAGTGGAAGAGGTCPAGFADCDTSTANLCETNIASDPQNCGACGSICQAGSHATVGCTNKSCTQICDPSYKDCNGNTADGCESDTQTDAANCGDCGKACPTGGVCTGGHCLTPI